MLDPSLFRSSLNFANLKCQPVETSNMDFMILHIPTNWHFQIRKTKAAPEHVIVELTPTNENSCNFPIASVSFMNVSISVPERPYFPFLLTVGNKVKPVGHGTSASETICGNIPAISLKCYNS